MRRNLAEPSLTRIFVFRIWIESLNHMFLSLCCWRSSQAFSKLF